MEYRELSKLYHANASMSRDSDLLAELHVRLHSESTFRTGYIAGNDELFLAMPREITLLSEKILRTERKVSLRMQNMPGIAGGAILRGLVLDEIVSSNEIEGVRSTKREIKDALNAMGSGGSAQKRFKELATLYMSILDQTARLPEEPADIRAIYDQVMNGELSRNDTPDGTLFRAHGVDIYNRVKVVHKGLEPEKKIYEAMAAMLEIAQSEEIPALYGAIVSHYLFEYAHPFYDGNGRTGRYLLALYLSIPLSMATSLSLSRTIAEHKDVYYNAFSIVQDPLNHGELTHFTYQLLGLISDAQIDILNRLETAQRSYGRLTEALDRINSDLKLNAKKSSAVFMLMQYETFGFLGDAPLAEIARHLDIGQQMTRKYLSDLEKIGVVCRARRRNPVTFMLTESFKREYGIKVPEWRIPADQRLA